MKSILNMLLKVGVPALAVFGYMNCSPTPFESYRTKANRAGFLNKAPTFIDIMSEYGSTIPVDTTTVSQESHKITIDAEQAGQCAAGDWDLMEVAITCKINANLIVTVADYTNTESLALKFPLDGSLTAAALTTQLLPAIQATVVGPNAHVFLCIDANYNNKCADEAIVDINTLSAQLVAGWQGINVDRNVVIANGLCTTLQKGVVFFHKLHTFGAQDNTSQVQVTTVDIASNVTQSILQNLDSQTTTTTTNAGTIVNFPIRLGKHNAAACPPPNVRTNGCFAKGTPINMTKDVSVPVENLRAGMKVYRADGSTTKIARVVAGPEASMYTFEMGAGSKITVTSEHPLVTNKGLRLAKDIQFGEELLGSDGGYITIVGIRQIPYNDLVYNFEVEGTAETDDHLVVAAKVVSGDLHLQNKMSKEAADKVPVNVLTAK